MTPRLFIRRAARADLAETFRSAPLRRFPFVVYFVELKQQVSVLAVIHGRRDPKRWRSRR